MKGRCSSNSAMPVSGAVDGRGTLAELHKVASHNGVVHAASSGRRVAVAVVREGRQRLADSLAGNLQPAEVGGRVEGGHHDAHRPDGVGCQKRRGVVVRVVGDEGTASARGDALDVDELAFAVAVAAGVNGLDDGPQRVELGGGNLGNRLEADAGLSGLKRSGVSHCLVSFVCWKESRQAESPRPALVGFSRPAGCPGTGHRSR